MNNSKLFFAKDEVKHNIRNYKKALKYLEDFDCFHFREHCGIGNDNFFVVVALTDEMKDTIKKQLSNELLNLESELIELNHK